MNIQHFGSEQLATEVGSLKHGDVFAICCLVIFLLPAALAACRMMKLPVPYSLSK